MVAVHRVRESVQVPPVLVVLCVDLGGVPVVINEPVTRHGAPIGCNGLRIQSGKELLHELAFQLKILLTAFCARRLGIAVSFHCLKLGPKLFQRKVLNAEVEHIGGQAKLGHQLILLVQYPFSSFRIVLCFYNNLLRGLFLCECFLEFLHHISKLLFEVSAGENLQRCGFIAGLSRT